MSGMRLAAGLLGAASLGGLFVPAARAGSCDGMDPPTMNWASSSNRIYVTGGCATMKDILDYRSNNKGAKGPLFHFDRENNRKTDYYTGTYFLESNLFVTDGATLSIDGRESDDDECETLLVASNSSFVLNIRAHGGNLKIGYTKIFSWDLDAGDYDTNIDDGRSYISAISEKITGRNVDTCPDMVVEEGESTGAAKNDMGVARMDIFRSEIGYLGYDNSESYGVSYKARGLCKDLSNLDIFDDDNGLDVAVYGNIIKSDLHHLYFGHYSYGHQEGKLNYNKIHDNYGYGFDPHDDSDYMRIVGNEVYNNGNHGIIASKRCNNAVIKRNTVYNNGGHGIMLHRSCDNARVVSNNVYDNGEAGVALYESSNCRVFTNTVTDNLHGIRLSNGASNNRVEGNEITLSSSDHVYAFIAYKGNDEPEVGDGRVRNNRIRYNSIDTNQRILIKYSEADDNEITDNVFKGGEEIEFEDCQNNVFEDNSFTTSIYFDIDGSCFEDGSDIGPIC